MTGRRFKDVQPTALPALPDIPISSIPTAQPFPDPIPGLVPFGSICTLSGASGVGKTALIASILPILLSGGELFGHPVNPTKVGILVSDRPWRDHSAWFAKSGILDIPHYSLRDVDYNWLALRDSAKVPAMFAQLVDKIALPPGSLLIVDPLALFLPGRLIDYKEMAIGFGLLDQQLKPRQLTTLGVFHVGKQKAGKQDRYMRPQDRILGSTALIGYSETAFYLLSPEEAEQSCYEFGAISHQAPTFTIDYKRTETGLFVPAHDLDRLSEQETACGCLPPLGETVSSSILVKQIATAAKCSDRTAYTLLRGLLISGRARKVGKGLYERAQAN